MMHVPHNAYVLVADGRKLLFLRNEGDGTFPNLQVELAEEHPNPADHDQKTGAAGRSRGTQSSSGAPASVGGGSSHQGGGAVSTASRGSMQETDFHQLEENRFAAEAAALLNRRALANDFEALIVIAPPKTLGELRKHYGKQLEGRIKGEIAKDLTGHTLTDIEHALTAA